VQVIFPTIFLEPLSEDPRFEAALMKSYNSWMASVCRKHPDRLKWAAVLPMRSVADAVEETRRAKNLGAVGLAVYGTVGETLLNHDDFDPVWSEAERLSASTRVGAIRASSVPLPTVTAPMSWALRSP
jgi:aminocarboxymuconate-semialdehyde decarboxylase